MPVGGNEKICTHESQHIFCLWCEKDYRRQKICLNEPAVRFKDKDVAVMNVNQITTNTL